MSSSNSIFRSLRNKISLILPEHARTARISHKIFDVEYGHIYSSKKKSSIGKNGNPIPWFTYPAIEYINQLDFSDKFVFEYGSGNSTLFWGSISKEVVGVEENKEWYQKVLNTINTKNTAVKLLTDRLSYTQEISKYDYSFDVIVIDGIWRYDCAIEAVKKLKNGGMIILDNSDWYTKTAKFLRESNLIQIDMAGFAPIGWNTQTTSFFLHREFNFQPVGANQPQGAIGSIKKPYVGGDSPGERESGSSSVPFH